MLAVKKQHPELDIRMVFKAPFNKISKRSKTTYAQWCPKKMASNGLHTTPSPSNGSRSFSKYGTKEYYMDCFLEVLGDCTDQKVDNVVDGFMMALEDLLITKPV